MGGEKLNHTNPFRVEPLPQESADEGVASIIATTTRKCPSRCEKREAFLRQALADKQATLVRLHEYEILVKELAEAIDKITEEKGATYSHNLSHTFFVATIQLMEHKLAI